MQLYICEKPSQARDLAGVLGVNDSRDGYIGNGGTTITWAIGHLVQLLEPDEVNTDWKKWRLEQLPMIPSNWQMKPNIKTKKQLNVVGKLLKKTKHVIIATDGDREGETIGRELLDYFSWKGTVERLWLTALDSKSIKNALDNIKKGEETQSLYQAGLARSRADWLVGMSLTRLMTLLSQNKSGHKGVLSVGRVQTPTLAIVVGRDLEIENFKAKDYFDIVGVFSGVTTKWQANKELGLDQVDEQGRCINLELAENVLNKVNNSDNATITTFETHHKKVVPPLLFSLSALQQQASKNFGYGAKQVLDISQSLYEKHKATTYPRTDCNYLPKSQLKEVPFIFDSLLQSDPKLKSLIDNADKSIVSRVFNDSKIKAHHSIVPTTKIININQLSEAEFNLYNLIRRRYIAQFYPNYEYDKTIITISVNNEIFTTSLNVDKAVGWKIVLSSNYKPQTANIPNMQIGQRLSIDSVDLQTKQTTPPARYTEGTLIGAMENAHLLVSDEKLKKVLKGNEGIGTEATRANIIQLLINRGFIDNKSKKLVSTNTGRTLIASVPKEIKDPAMTAYWESSLGQIESGKLNLESFINWQERWLHQFVNHYKDKI